MMLKLKRPSSASQGSESVLKRYKNPQMIQPNYFIPQNENPLKSNTILIPLIIGKKSFKYLVSDENILNPTSAFDFFSLFNNYLYSSDFSKALEAIEKCIVIDKKYLKWKMLVLYLQNSLSLFELNKIDFKDWKLENLMLKLFLTLDENIARELFDASELHGAIAWSKVFQASSWTQKENIIVSILRKAIQKFPKDCEAYLMLVKILEKKSCSQAIGLCDAALLNLSCYQSEVNVFFILTQAKLYVKQKNFMAAMQLLKESYKKFRSFNKILFYYGKYIVEWKNRDYVSAGISALKVYNRSAPSYSASYWIIEGYYVLANKFKMLKEILKLDISKFSKKKKQRIETLLLTHKDDIHIANAQIENKIEELKPEKKDSLENFDIESDFSRNRRLTKH